MLSIKIIYLFHTLSYIKYTDNQSVFLELIQLNNGPPTD